MNLNPLPLISRCSSCIYQATCRAFSHFSRIVGRATSHPLSFVTALSVIVSWSVWAWHRRFDDFSQLLVNTSTTIITFLMLFLAANDADRRDRAIQQKLDTLIIGVPAADNEKCGLEDKIA